MEHRVQGYHWQGGIMPEAGRLGDKAQCPSDAHGCPACAHGVIGPAIAGSPDVNINSRPALRVGDPGMHSACCGPNTWTAAQGSATVFINTKAAHRKGDMTTHCGGVGKLVEGSPNVNIGGSPSAGGSQTQLANAAAGALAGGVIGGMLGGPLGAVVGAAVGAVVGALVTTDKQKLDKMNTVLANSKSGSTIADTLKQKNTSIEPMNSAVRTKYQLSPNTLNVKVGNTIYIDPSYSPEQGAAHMAHEGQHIVDDSMPYGTNQEILEVETRAFESEAKAWKELKANDPTLADPLLDGWVNSLDSGTLRSDVSDLYYDPKLGPKGK